MFYYQQVTILIFYSVGETIVWGRDCYTPSDGYIGCREEQRHEKPAQVCYCDGDLCNARMEDITTSTTTTTTPKGKNYQMKQSNFARITNCQTKINFNNRYLFSTRTPMLRMR